MTHRNESSAIFTRERRRPGAPGASRACSTSGCDLPARKRGYTCGRCSTRRWRSRHRATIAARERARTFSEEQQAARRAGAILFTYVRRGKRTRGTCHTCGRAEVVPHWPDLKAPLEVVWFCRSHRLVERERLAEDGAAEAKQAQWNELRARFEVEWPTLSAEVQARLHAEVASSPAVRTLRAKEGSIFYQQQLTFAFGRYRATFRGQSSSTDHK